MRRRAVMTTALFFVSPLLLGACSTIIPTRAGAPPPPETPAVLGTAIIAPGSVVPVVADAGRADRQVVEAAEFDDVAKTANFSSDGFTRITSQIARSLATLGRSVRQLVADW